MRHVPDRGEIVTPAMEEEMMEARRIALEMALNLGGHADVRALLESAKAIEAWLTGSN